MGLELSWDFHASRGCFMCRGAGVPNEVFGFHSSRPPTDLYIKHYVIVQRDGFYMKIDRSARFSVKEHMLY